MTERLQIRKKWKEQTPDESCTWEAWEQHCSSIGPLHITWEQFFMALAMLSKKKQRNEGNPYATVS